MTTYAWSTITTAQGLTFNSATDQVVFDAGGSATQVAVSVGAAVTTLTYAGKSVIFQNTGLDPSVTPTVQFLFLDGSVLAVNGVTDGAGHNNNGVGGPGGDQYVSENDTTNGTSQDTVLGNGGDDIIRLGDGNDVGGGGTGNDNINGNVGNDFLIGAAGNDTLFGGQGNDTLGSSGMVVAGSGGALIGWDDAAGTVIYDNGTSRVTYTVTEDGDDSLNGNLGNDVVLGGNGNDSLFGGQNQDVVVGGQGDDSISGDLGDDTLVGGADRDTLYGQDGNDSIDGGTGNDLIFGNAGNDTILDGGGANTIYGGQGDDAISVGSDTTGSWVSGDLGSDFLIGGTGADTLFGGAGNDTIISGNGNDSIDGGAGNDVIFGGTGKSYLGGGDGNDTIQAGSGTETIAGGAGNDRFDESTAGSAYSTDATTLDNIVGFETGKDTLAIQHTSTIAATSFNNIGSFATYSAAAASAANQSSGTVTTVFVAQVGSDSYLFIDGDHNGTLDQAIKLVGLGAGGIAQSDLV